MTPTRLLHIQPKELQFIFEMEKDITCQIHLVNNTDDHVAYKVKTSTPEKYRVEPNMGIIMPRSISEFLTVTIQAQWTTPPADKVCEDNILIESTIVPFWTTKEDIKNPTMFLKDHEEGKYIEEEKFKVALLCPPINKSLKMRDQDRPLMEGMASNEIAPKLKDQNATSSEGMMMPIEFGLLRQGDMSRMRLLDIQPKELRFVFESEGRITCEIQLFNNTDHHVAYKVKTTAPKKYVVRPNMEIIMPNSASKFTTVSTKAPPTDMVCKDKFLILSTIVPSTTTENDIINNPNMFSKDEGRFIEEDKFKVILPSPPIDAPLKEELKALKLRDDQNGSLKEEMMMPSEIGSLQQGDMSYTSLLDVQPKKFQFVFELKKQISCQVQLVNNTHHHVAYRVKTTAPKKFCVRPNKGIILPKSTDEFVTITMQAQRTVPPNMECKDKFLIQSTIVPSWTTKDDIINKNQSMFSKDEGNCIEEEKFTVNFLVAHP